MSVKFYNQWYDCLNPFSSHAVELDGIVYPTAEHAYQAAKCTDPKGKSEIIAARSPLLAKELSNKKYSQAKRADWEEVKIEIMEAIFKAKLDQHSEVREALIQSGGDEIVEDSPVDTFWGGGSDGKGRNEMGKIWMRLRDGLRSEMREV